MNCLNGYVFLCQLLMYPQNSTEFHRHEVAETTFLVTSESRKKNKAFCLCLLLFYVNTVCGTQILEPSLFWANWDREKTFINRKLWSKLWAKRLPLAEIYLLGLLEKVAIVNQHNQNTGNNSASGRRELDTDRHSLYSEKVS